MSAHFVKDLQEIHVAAWNEKEENKRIDLLRKIYAEDVKMYDKDFILQSLKEVSGFIGKLIAEDPEFHFSAAKPIDPLQNGARFYGHIQTSQGMLNSMDFFLIEDEKVKHLYAFMELAN
jgi:hypothetical protein